MSAERGRAGRVLRKHSTMYRYAASGYASLCHTNKSLHTQGAAPVTSAPCGASFGARARCAAARALGSLPARSASSTAIVHCD